MPSRGRVSSCSGRYLLLLISLCGPLLSACAALPVGGRTASTLEHVQFLMQATQADPAGRRQLWFDLLRQPDGDDRELRLAFLESLPGHPGSSPAAARFHLNQISTGTGSDAIRAMAKLRLSQLNQHSLPPDCPDIEPPPAAAPPAPDTESCELSLQQAGAELRELRARLAALVEIETQSQGEGDEALDSDRR